MPPELDIEDILNEVAKFQSHIREVHSRLTHPQERELLGEVIAKIEESQSQVRETYPRAIEAIETGANDAKQQAQSNLAEAAKLKAQLESMLKQQAAAKQAGPPLPEPPPFDFQLGQRLSQELFAQLHDNPETEPADKISDREIWQDWSWAASEKN